MKNTIFALIDCNNFFVSCERIFRPDLEGKPVVVLSSNDGCAVARSNEAKRLDIPMGAPAFKYRQLFKEQGVVQFSANFELYGDISERITCVLTALTPHIEVYSVDESFLDLSDLPITDYTAWGRAVRGRILKEIGVPVSIGIATSKTLAKLAAERAKKSDDLHGVLSLLDIDTRPYLQATPLKDIWGVGWRLAPKLKAEGLFTAYDLAQLAPRRADRLMGLHGRHMVAELNGTSCLPLKVHSEPQKSIMRGRMFGQDTAEPHVIEAAVASLTARAAFELRREGQLAKKASLFITTNRNKPGYRWLSAETPFATPTADTGTLTAALVQLLQHTYRRGPLYHRAGITLYDLIPETALQTDLLGQVRPDTVDASRARMRAVDGLNARFGKGTVHSAAEDLSHSWEPKRGSRSPRYTTAWDELPVLRVG
ncbi:MAG TPA: Y-family DNA polymerase [Candidatus Saccharimonadales bacterium]|nr:Y-family DNA polymerase [Candidatus Saccharimonadales bacterium]